MRFARFFPVAGFPLHRCRLHLKLAAHGRRSSRRGGGGVAGAGAEKSVTWSPNSRAALLRDESGAIVGTTYGGAACWFPRRSKRGDRFAAIDATGAESVIRCGWCPGCRELDRQRLARRLVELYKEFAGDIWIAIAPARLSRHGAIATAIHRSRRLKFEPATYRLGADHVAFIAKGDRPALFDSRSRVLRSLKWRVVRLKRSRGRRAWAIVTAGILINREEYGEWRNRFYHRGLKPLERDREWQFSASFAPGLSAAAGRNRGVRAFAAGVSTHFPEAIALPHLLNRRRRALRASDAASVNQIVASIFERAAGGASLLTPRRAKRAASSTVAEFRDARSMPASAPAVERVPPRSAERSLNLIKGAGYQGSLHLRDRARPDFSDWAKRMAAKARARGDPPESKG